jgi:hypothetical protein
MTLLDDTTRHEFITLLAPILAREDRRRELLALALEADNPALRQVGENEWRGPPEAFVLRLVDALARSGEAGRPAFAGLLDFARERVTDDRRPRVAALAAMILFSSVEPSRIGANCSLMRVCGQEGGSPDG